ncbi:uncharacterized protein LOC119555991 [Drosophila subpulchrella]|uniref:uncharacterized protein LOC119555991 n=1 Tax=Drosophila subpulchrella TaxID=1486046 RepID=UPI0018A15883|nr:uncharacterized protein LOC119555991 [Drosophila subpulchrella]
MSDTNPNGKRSAGGESPIDDQDAEFIVEKIVGKSFLNGRPHVLVKWQGYPIEQSTWEPLEEMDKCLDLVSDYEQQLFNDCQEKAKAKVEKELAKDVDPKVATTSVGAAKQSEGSSVQAQQVKVVNEQPDPLLPTTSSGGSPTKVMPQGLPPFPVLIKQEDQEYPTMLSGKRKPVVSFTEEKQLTTVEEEDPALAATSSGSNPSMGSVDLVKQEVPDYPTPISSSQEKQQNIVEEGEQGLAITSSESKLADTSIANAVVKEKDQEAPTTSSKRKTAWGSNQPWNGKKKGKGGKNKAKLAKTSKAASTQPKPTTMDVGSDVNEDLPTSSSVSFTQATQPTNSLPAATGKGAKPKKLKLASVKKTSDETLGSAASTQQKPTNMDVGSEVDDDLPTSSSGFITQATQPKNSLPAATGKGAKTKKLKLASANNTSDETIEAAAPLPLAASAALPENPLQDALNALPNLEQMTIRDPDQIKIDQLLAELDDRLSRPIANAFNLSRARGNGGRNGRNGRGGRRGAGNPWNQPYQGIFGLDRGLEMEKVEHSFKIRDLHFLFVTWKGCPEMDTVTLPSVRYLYPKLVIDYLEMLKGKRR